MNVLSHPLHGLAIFGVIVAIVLGMAVFRCRGAQMKILLLLLAGAALVPATLVVVASYFDWVDPRFQVYQSFFEDIQPGMTRAEVMALCARHYPDGGPRQPPRIMVDDGDNLTFFMHPEEPDSSVDCEGILLTLQDGRVLNKTYSPD